MMARKGSPVLLLNVARVVSRRTISAVPAGTGVCVWAASTVAKREQGTNIHNFMATSAIQKLPLNVDQVFRAGKQRTVHREPAEIRGRLQWPNGHSRIGKTPRRTVSVVTFGSRPSDIIVGFITR